MSDHLGPSETSLRWTITVCPVCHRSDRYTSLGAQKHFMGGNACEGVPEKVEVMPVAEYERALYLGDQLANAIRGLDSYAAASFPCPLERSQAAEAALLDWEAMKNG